jgi:hypothetical protein
MGCLTRSGLCLYVPGYVPGLRICKPLRHKGCSDRSGRSDLTARVRHMHTITHTSINTRNRLARVDIYPEHSEHMEQRSNGKASRRSGFGTQPGTFALNPERRHMTTQKPGNLRAEMPLVSAFIDDMRAAFGAEMVNTAIRAGLDGQPTFWASENGRTVGRKGEGAWVRVSDTSKTQLSATVHAGRGRK